MDLLSFDNLDCSVILHAQPAGQYDNLCLRSGEVVGSSERDQVAVHVPGLAPVHAVFFFEAQENVDSSVACLIENLTGQAALVRVNGEIIPPNQRQVISPDSDITLGPYLYKAQIRIRPGSNPQPRATQLHLPQTTLFPETYLRLHQGKRPFQEDAIGLYSQVNPQDNQPETLWIVADGVASEKYGALASEYVVQSVLYRFFSHSAEAPVQDRLRNTILSTSRQLEIYAAQIYAQTQQRIRPTSTIVAVALASSTWWIAHVGDSRAYLWQAQRFDQLTQDHIVAYDRIEKGETPEKAFQAPGARKLKYWLGKPGLSELTITEHRAFAGDKMLLCSDGMSRYLEIAELQEDCLTNKTAELPEQWLGKALTRGGADNISIVVIEAVREMPSDTPVSSHPRVFTTLTPPHGLEFEPAQPWWKRFIGPIRHKR